MSVINTNITSMISQKNLNTSKNSLTTAMERLSSGMRINSAKDDAAGQAIANRMTSQVKGLAQAQRNANDGISVAQTAEGALNQINDNLQRIRELAVQAQNGTNNQDDLTSIQNEIGQRLTEINRISEETSFNGVKVLAGDEELSIQVGSQDGQTIKIGLKEINATTLGLTGFNVDGKATTPNAAASADDLVLAGFSKATSANANGSYTYSKTDTVQNTAASISSVLGKATNGSTVTYTGDNNGTGVAAKDNTYTYNAASNSFSFDAAAVAAADTASYLTEGMSAGERRNATITIASTDQEVQFDNEGKVFAADDGAVLYLDTTGNLTKNNSGGLNQATLGTLAGSMTNAAAADNTYFAGANAVKTDGTGASDETVAFTFSDVAAGATVTIGGRTLTAGADMTGEQVAKAFADNYTGPATVESDDAEAGTFTMTGTATAAPDHFAPGAASGNTLTFTAQTTNTDVADLTFSATESKGSIKVGNTSIVADAGANTFTIRNASISASNMANTLTTDGGKIDVGDGKVYDVTATTGAIKAGVTESTEVTFGALKNGDTLTLSDGTNTLKLTASTDLTAEKVAEAFYNHLTGGAAVAGATMSAVEGNVAGFMNVTTGWTASNPNGGTSLSLTSNKADTNVANISLGGTAVTSASVSATEGVALSTAYVDASSGALTLDSSAQVTTSYYAQADGSVTNNTGAKVFKDQGGALTLEATTAGGKTEDPLATLDAALNKVDALRSDLGAIQNRFDSAITNLKTNETNLAAARSRIEDADYAVEVANMTRAQILQQAGTSVLAQANQVPQGVLSLLR